MARTTVPSQRRERQWQQLAAAAHFDAKELARLCRLSLRQLQREFRRCLGCAPQAWLNAQRIAAARRLLPSAPSVGWVTEQLGFKQASHFTRQFKEISHMTPSEYKLAQQPAEEAGCTEIIGAAVHRCACRIN